MDVTYLSVEFPDRELYLCPQDYVSLGIPAKIYDWIFSGGAKKTDVKKVFQFMKLEELMAGEDSKLEETHSELVGTHFTTGKIKFR